ncbi:hypothetical protein ACLMJK_000969 [Lecanora helva]
MSSTLSKVSVAGSARTTIVLKERKRLEPRNASYELQDSNQLREISTILSEYDKRSLGDRPKIPQRKPFSEASKHFRRIFHVHQKMKETSNLSEDPRIAFRETSNGRKYGQIYDPSNTISTYEVNNIVRSTATKGSRKSTASSKKMSKEGRPERSTEKNSEQINSLVIKSSVHRPKRKDHSVQECVCSGAQDVHFCQNALVPTETDKIQYIDELPPLSPIKVSLDEDIGSPQAHLENPISRQPHKRPIFPLTSLQRSEDRPQIRDFANATPSASHQYQSAQPKSKDRIAVQESIAGAPHNYGGFPRYGEQFDGIQTSEAKKPSHRGKNRAAKFEERSPPAPLSPTAYPPDSGIAFESSPTTDDHCKRAPVVSADSATEDAHSDTSSVIISNAQHGTRPRGQPTTGSLGVNSVHIPPMPSPPPTTALPSLPRTHYTPAPLQAIETTSKKKALEHKTIEQDSSQISPKKNGYSFFPRECGPSKGKQLAFPAVPTKEVNTAARPPPPSPSPLRVKKRGRSNTSHNCVAGGVQNGASKQYQQQELVQRQPWPLTHKSSQSMIVEGKSEWRNSETHSKHNHVSSDPQESDNSSGLEPIPSHPPHKAEPNRAPIQLSPITVVASQEPTKPPPLTPSQKPQHNHITTTDVAPSPQKQLYDSHPFPSQTANPPAKERNDEPLSPHQPESTHSHSLSTRTPTPLTHTLFRTHSVRSQQRASWSPESETNDSERVSELEARLAAIEKKNVMLERIFLAMQAGLGMSDGMGEREGVVNGRRVGGGVDGCGGGGGGVVVNGVDGRKGDPAGWEKEVAFRLGEGSEGIGKEVADDGGVNGGWT